MNCKQYFKTLEPAGACSHNLENSFFIKYIASSSRENMKIRKKSNQIPNNQECRCKSHHEWSKDIKAAKISSYKKFRAPIIREMRRIGFLSVRGDFLCKCCYQHFVENYRIPDEVEGAACNNGEDTVHEGVSDGDEEASCEETDYTTNQLLTLLIQQLQSRSFSELNDDNEHLWAQLLFLIGDRLCRQPVYEDGIAIKSLYKDKQFLIDLDIQKFIRERNQNLVQFICSLTGLRFELASNQLQFSFATAIEMCYYPRNLNLVPHCFLGNLIQSCISGSKSVSVVNGKTSPGGSYATYKKWIGDKGSTPLRIQNDGTIELWFDNIGRYINKQYRVTTTKMKSADVITTCIQVVLNDPNRLQEFVEFKPQREIQDIKQLHVQMENKINESNENFRIYRYRFVEKILALVKNENDSVETKLDAIQTVMRICSDSKCSATYDTKTHGMKRKCDKCGGSVVKEVKEPVSLTGGEMWADLEKIDIGQKSSEVRPSIRMAESILKNPNSYQNVKVILNEIKKVACSESSSREWTFLGCDGPPYCLSERLAEEEPEMLDFAHFIPGLGHLHMNMMKTLFKILDAVILDPLGREVLNFESPKAKKFFVDAKDTHKSWQTVQILLFGTTMELCKEYMINESPDDVNALGFLEWVSGTENANVKLIGEFMLNYTLSIYFQKIGIRNNDVKLVDAARFKFDDLFYAFHHPIYREVEYRDLKNRIQYKEPVQNLREKNMSFSETELSKKSQGGDFVLEGKVQRQKLIAPKGIVNCKTWQTLARCLDEFEDIYASASSKLNIGSKDAPKVINLADEIIKWRAILRMSDYLVKPSYSLPRSIYDEVLSNDMINFSAKVKKKRKECWELLERGESIVTVKYPYMVVVPGCEVDDLLYREGNSDSEDEDEDEG